MKDFNSRPESDGPNSGIVLSALRGGSGKTVLSIGIIAAWKKSGTKVSPFKKGPDYIDAGWLALAAGQPCYNLDTFLQSEEHVLHSFYKHSKNSDLAVIEGNRGLYDGIEVQGKTSTAEIAKLLQLPVFLILDCTKTTRTTAAVVNGITAFDREVMIGGILLNRVAGSRHERILRASIEQYCDVKVFGAVPKFKNTDIFPERHMGLVPTPEHDWAFESIDMAANIAKMNIDLEAVYEKACQPIDSPNKRKASPEVYEISSNHEIILHEGGKPKIGIIKDAAFQFYYADNLEALSGAGAELIFTSPLSEEALPEIDALYIGGGFPETHADELDHNRQYAAHLKQLADQGLPIYAECGGLIYLGQEIEMKEKRYRMTGVLPIVFGISKRPVGHGYTVNEVEIENPFFKVGEVIKGHEFRYSTVLHWGGKESDLIFKTIRGTGFYNNRDGIIYKNVFAAYTHLHSIGVSSWAPSLIQNALSFRNSKISKGPVTNEATDPKL